MACRFHRQTVRAVRAARDRPAVRADGRVVEEGADLILEAGGDRRLAAALPGGPAVEGARQQHLGEPRPPDGRQGLGVAALGEGDPAVGEGEQAVGHQLGHAAAGDRDAGPVLLDELPELREHPLELDAPRLLHLGQPAVLEADLAVGAGGDRGVVGDQDQGVTALVEVGQERHHDRLVDRVEVPRRLVGEDQRRLVDQRPGDADPLLLASGELARQMAQPLAQAHPAQRLLGLAAVGHAVDVLGEHDVLQRGEVGDQMELLEDQADRPLPVARQLAAGEARRGRRRRRAPCPRSDGRGRRGC